MKLAVNDKILAVQFDNGGEQQETLSFFAYDDFSLTFLGGSYNKNRIRKIQFLKKQKDWWITNSGFLKELLYFIKKNHFPITLFDDKRTKFSHQAKEYSDEELSSFFPFDYNDHQIRVLRKLLKVNVGVVKATTSAGKCCTGDVKINIDGVGEIEIRKLFAGIGEEEIKIINEKNIKILTEDGYKKINCLYKTNKRNVLEIELENGIKIKGVPEHKIKTKSGWKELKDLNDDDEVEFYEEKC